MRATSALSSRHDSSRRAPRSLQNTSAGSASGPRSRFSAKLSRVPGNQRAPGMHRPSSRTALPRSAAISAKSKSAAQNAAGSATDQW
jgi:hypothetical protein